MNNGKKDDGAEDNADAKDDVDEQMQDDEDTARNWIYLCVRAIHHIIPFALCTMHFA